MSGGSMDYLYYKIEEEAVGRMGDAELNELMKDVAKLVREAEWWESGDTCEATYRQFVAVFKRKWFGKTAHRSERLARLIDEKLDQVRKECRQMIGFEEVSE